MSSIYPLALYRDGSDIEWDRRRVGFRIVTDADDHETALSEGWREADAYLSGAASLTLLDATAKEIAAVLPELTLDELEALKAAETAGKTRKGVLADIDAAIDAKLKD